VHWHLGAEHKNDGTYSLPPPTNLVANTGRRLASTNEAGHWCPAVTDASINMVDNYVFKHCTDMHVGYTYEIHWPHSTLGACGTKWQYQSHFMDGAPPPGTTPWTPFRLLVCSRPLRPASLPPPDFVFL